MSREHAGVAVVVVTRDRIVPLRSTLRSLSRLSAASPIVVVDNGSSDGTPRMVRSEFPDVALISLEENLGSAARNVGVAAADADLVAFADDDSAWAPGSLERARSLFEANPALGLVAARILVGDDRRVDPVCRQMDDSPLGHWSGRQKVLGFVACGAVVRRSAFCAAGGFERLLFFLGEEETLALDMAAQGWQLVYAPEVVAYHRPGEVARDTAARRRRHARNRLLSSLIHRPWSSVWANAGEMARRSVEDSHVRAGLGEALRMFPRAVARRRPIPADLELARRLLDGASHQEHVSASKSRAKLGRQEVQDGERRIRS